MNFNLSTVYPVYPGTGYSIGGLPSYAKLGPFDTHPPHLEISLLACVFWKAPRRGVCGACGPRARPHGDQNGAVGGEVHTLLCTRFVGSLIQVLCVL